jgi:hypothetical protein
MGGVVFHKINQLSNDYYIRDTRQDHLIITIKYLENISSCFSRIKVLILVYKHLVSCLLYYSSLSFASNNLVPITEHIDSPLPGTPSKAPVFILANVYLWLLQFTFI